MEKKRKIVRRETEKKIKKKDLKWRQKRQKGKKGHAQKNAAGGGENWNCWSCSLISIFFLWNILNTVIFFYSYIFLMMFYFSIDWNEGGAWSAQCVKKKSDERSKWIFLYYFVYTCLKGRWELDNPVRPWLLWFFAHYLKYF